MVTNADRLRDACRALADADKVTTDLLDAVENTLDDMRLEQPDLHELGSPQADDDARAALDRVLALADAYEIAYETIAGRLVAHQIRRAVEGQ